MVFKEQIVFSRQFKHSAYTFRVLIVQEVLFPIESTMANLILTRYAERQMRERQIIFKIICQSYF